MRSIILLSLTAGITDPVLREEFGKRKIKGGTLSYLF